MPRMTAKAYISVIPIAFKQKAKDDAYRFYISDVLKTICENFAKKYGGSYIKSRYSDIINPKKRDDRTSDEIINSIKEKLDKICGDKS